MREEAMVLVHSPEAESTPLWTPRRSRAAVDRARSRTVQSVARRSESGRYAPVPRRVRDHGCATRADAPQVQLYRLAGIQAIAGHPPNGRAFPVLPPSPPR